MLEILSDRTRGSDEVAAIEALGLLGERQRLEGVGAVLDGASAAEQAAARKSLIRLQGDAVVCGDC